LDQWPISITTGPFSKGTPAYSFFWRLSVDTYNKADRILITSKSFENYFNKELKLSTEKYGLDYWPQYAEDIYQNTFLGEQHNILFVRRDLLHEKPSLLYIFRQLHAFGTPAEFSIIPILVNNQYDCSGA